MLGEARKLVLLPLVVAGVCLLVAHQCTALPERCVENLMEGDSITINAETRAAGHLFLNNSKVCHELVYTCPGGKLDVTITSDITCDESVSGNLLLHYINGGELNLCSPPSEIYGLDEISFTYEFKGPKPNQVPNYNVDLTVACTPPLICEAGWTMFESSCYLFDSTQRGWCASNLVCLAHGGYLAKIESNAENVFAKTLITGNTWIGLNDIVNEGQYKWVDGSSLGSFSDWSTSQPDNNGNNEDCVEIRQPAPFNYRWNDHVCSSSKGALCEKPASPATQAPAAP